jgi:hypothetical protein
MANQARYFCYYRIETIMVRIIVNELCNSQTLKKVAPSHLNKFRCNRSKLSKESCPQPVSPLILHLTCFNRFESVAPNLFGGNDGKSNETRPDSNSLSPE